MNNNTKAQGIAASLTGCSILLFGSLALSFNASSLKKLRKTVVESDDNIWLLEVIQNLPKYCERALSAIPELQTTGILHQKQLFDLSEFITTGRSLDTEFPLPNTLLIPLVVIAQLTDYATFLKQADVGHNGHDDSWAAFTRNKTTLGLCTGLLSAFAVSSSHNTEEFRTYGASAVRLGMLVGMVVDSRDTLSNGRTKSLTAAWSHDKTYKEMTRILNEFANSYISVHYDDNRATITTSGARVSDLTRKLRGAGLGASEIDLYGAFHSAENSSIVQSIITFCDSNAAFQFPDATALAMPSRASDDKGTVLAGGALHSHALRSILLEPPRWFDAFSAAIGHDADVNVISFGYERSIPPSLLSKVKLVNGTKNDFERDSTPDRRHGSLWMESDIAVVGMSCKVAGADDVNEFWDVLMKGESQHREISQSSRFSFQNSQFRTSNDPNMRRKWFANLIRSHDQFDHRFFKKSARESATMDPQQRHLLQVAYQAVEQSGYFQTEEAEREAKIGCFVGVCLSDYENNVACHAANAFTATGNLQGFIAGKVSHSFGWTGPGLTIDTACSSSLVAVHQACLSILSGECNAALAGGTHIMTTPGWFQNLAAGSFLSPTGQCKPFDVHADGYCRGEGVGAVFLKRLDRAVEDGDPILGVIGATAVQQNQNCTPIFVPNVPSLADLFTTVMAKARVRPSQISVVEAHGTGTAVGDPAEYSSIRKVLGGTNRASEQPLMVSSVKGLVGHLECTSGIIGLIKVLLMLDKGVLPPQASFRQLNPALEASPADHMFLPTEAQPWDTDFRVSLINNYGASGSNASLVVMQAPSAGRGQEQKVVRVKDAVKYPFWLSGNDDKSLRRYATAFRKFLARLETGRCITNISFNVAHQSNRGSSHGLVFTARSIQELDQSLAAAEKGKISSSIFPISSAPSPVRPVVVLCFGGQISRFIGLDPQLYASVAVFRRHLDHVDTVIQSLGNESIFPGIFQRTAFSDTVHLQSMLFATQYACARSWMDSGIRPVALVGYSFGELTALCISQALSLEDTVKMIVSRAKVVRDAWGTDRGAMMAVQGDLRNVEELLIGCNSQHSGEPASIACYNGPRSFTLSGSTEAIDAVAAQLSGASNTKFIKSKRLNVTNAFHSALVDPLLDTLEQGAQGLIFRKPVIPLERATEHTSEVDLTAKFVAQHMRSPVYFHHAVKRLARKYASSPCIFLEAGTNSTITAMAANALDDPGIKGAYSFQGLNVASGDDSWDRLVDCTVSLWKTGLNFQHWAHHPLQRRHQAGIKHLMLPPYQFDPDARHWLNLKIPAAKNTPTAASRESGKEEEGLLGLFTSEGDPVRKAQFRINTTSVEYKKLLSGHMTIQTAPICPATVQIGLVIEAISTIRQEYRTKTEPQIQDVEYQSPVCANSARETWIEVINDPRAGASWQFKVFSTENQNGAQMAHTTGKVSFSDATDQSLKHQLSLFKRLFDHDRTKRLLQSTEVDEVLGNRTIYRIFADIVDYGEEFRGLQKLVSHGNESAGHIIRKKSGFGESLWFDAHLADTFCQLGGIWINCMMERTSGDVYLANRIDQWIRAPLSKRPREFDVFATHHLPSDRLSQTDVFVFDAANGALVEVILGVAYVKIPKLSMQKLLTRLTEPEWLAKSSPRLAPTAATSIMKPVGQVSSVDFSSTTAAVVLLPNKLNPESSHPRESKQEAHGDLLFRVKTVIAELSGVEVAEIRDNSELADLGIDSLTGMEMVNEIEKTFQVKLPENEILTVVDMPGLMRCLAGAMGLSTDIRAAATSDGVNEDSDSDTRSDTRSIMTWSESAVIATSLSTPAPESGIDSEDSLSEFTEGSLIYSTVLDSFNETKKLTDKRVAELEQTHYVAEKLPLQNRLTAVLTLETFEGLGAGFRSSQPGEHLPRIPHRKEHTSLVDYLYRMLETETQIITVYGDIITRTAVPFPELQSQKLYEEMIVRFPDQHPADKLTYYAGSNLRRVLSGETDGVKLIFGSSEGRSLVSTFYAEWPLNRVLYAQMEEFLKQLTARLRSGPNLFTESKPLRILEMGAGTGGTTRRLVPLLAQLQVPVEYTFTDLGPSFVAAARKTWGKQFPWMKFRVHDIEKAPEQDLAGTQHFVIASNAVHATHSLQESTRNVRKVLRPDGFLLMLEMTRTPYWVDLIFGLFEGWWIFDDEREHALTHESLWERELQAAGYGYVDWTDGERPESDIEKLILAAASSTSRCERRPQKVPYQGYQPKKGASASCAAREQVVEKYVSNLTAGFGDRFGPSPMSALRVVPSSLEAKCILITGTTGNLGAHLVAEAAMRDDIRRVICLNRRGRQDPQERQSQALLRKGLKLPPDAMRKIEVFETDLSQPPNLGLPDDIYLSLVQDVTHILHNAWLMHSKWAVERFEPQLRIMANMLYLARDISIQRPQCHVVTFEFVSSIATVGHHPLWTGSSVVPEERVGIESVLPTGYGDAKYICERMLDATLHRHPERFRATAVRLGQVAGSSINGHWNPMEHVPFLIKSAQTLGALPDLQGSVGWTPADDVAGGLVEILVQPDNVLLHPIYHIENPVRQHWQEMITLLARALDIPRDSTGIIPFDEWLLRVRDWPRREDNRAEGANPAYLLVDFLTDNFARMSCGGLLLGTARAREHSTTMARVGPVRDDLSLLFVKSWKDMGFLA